jgi:hypothetical protein
MRHHPSCSDEGAHIHAIGPTFIPHQTWALYIDSTVHVVCGDEALALRLAELINTHGLASVPDRIPDSVLWAPPHPDDRLVDWRLPAVPQPEGTVTDE